MPIFNKYKNNLYLIFENATEYEIVNKNIKKPINYLYNHRSKFIRNFSFFYSFFLVVSPFSVFTYKNNPEFNLKLSLSSLLLITGNYNDLVK